jgi:16S rRNA (guanine1207-N2)-methyltransferase
MTESPLDPAFIGSRVHPPVVIVLGSPAEVVRLVADLGTDDVTCYQMDLYQAGRVEEELRAHGFSARVVTAPDLWDLGPEFRTAVYPPAQGGERALKIDMVEQAYHVLRPHGVLVVASPYEADALFPGLVKKVFGRYHAPLQEAGQVVWGQRERDRPRRRHETTFQVRADDGPPFRFVSRPGVFSYGRFDEGALALVEVMDVRAGDRVADVGCGCGTNGIIAARRAGPDGGVTFLDSNVRALALAEHNARLNGVDRFEVVASSRVEGPAEQAFDVALANPPYYAQLSIARLFIERGMALLRPGGRFYLVSKQPDQVGPLVAQVFGMAEPVQRRGYTVLYAQRPMR